MLTKKILLIQNTSYTKYFLYKILLIQNASYTKCFLYKILLIQKCFLYKIQTRDIGLLSFFLISGKAESEYV